MCGIFGVYHKHDARPVDEAFLRRAASTMDHRGPDGEGYWTDQGIGLAHKRLSIIDRAGGHQPIFNEDDSLVIIFNGEIYNYRELRSTLIGRGHSFRTMSDTEVIVHAYEEYGERCVEYLRGMFAFAIYDRNERRLFLARDRFGIKPLYYFENDDLFAFSSEVKPILALPGYQARVNRPMIDHFMTLGYTPAPQTLFAGILKVEPANTLTITGRSKQARTYWQLDPSNKLEISFDDAKRRLSELLLECVDIRLMSEVPLGAFLSGGLDSSTVVGLMSQLRVGQGAVRTFSVGFDDAPDTSELAYARVVADHFQTEHHEFNLTHGDFFESVDDLLHHTEEPLLEPPAVALHQLSKLAKPKATVLLSGEGSDEVFAGYPIYPRMGKIEQMHKVWRLVPGPIRAQTLKLLGATEKLEKYIDWVGTPFARRYRTIPSDLVEPIRLRMYTDKFLAERGEGVESLFERFLSMNNDESMLERMLLLDTRYWLPDDLLLKADKMTMAASIELRVPFLDHHLAEFAHSLPDEYKLKGGEGKLLLKRAAEAFVPRSIVYREKKGFPIPIDKWFRGGLKDKIAEVLLDERTFDRGYFRPEYLRNILQLHGTGRQELSNRIFSLVVLEMWHRKYID